MQYRTSTHYIWMFNCFLVVIMALCCWSFIVTVRTFLRHFNISPCDPVPHNDVIAIDFMSWKKQVKQKNLKGLGRPKTLRSFKNFLSQQLSNSYHYTLPRSPKKSQFIRSVALNKYNFYYRWDNNPQNVHEKSQVSFNITKYCTYYSMKILL